MYTDTIMVDIAVHELIDLNIIHRYFWSRAGQHCRKWSIKNFIITGYTGIKREKEFVEYPGFYAEGMIACLICAIGRFEHIAKTAAGEAHEGDHPTRRAYRSSSRTADLDKYTAVFPHGKPEAERVLEGRSVAAECGGAGCRDGQRTGTAVDNLKI